MDAATYERLRQLPKDAREFEDRPRQQIEADLKVIHAYLDSVVVTPAPAVVEDPEPELEPESPKKRASSKKS